MAWVYILRGETGRHYIGSTTDLDRRINQHRNGLCHTTRRLGARLDLVAALELGELAEARQLERELKRKKNPDLAIHLLKQRGESEAVKAAPKIFGVGPRFKSGRAHHINENVEM